MIAFGERVLREHNIPFEKVVRVDFTLEGDRSWSSLTPGYSEYPVRIRYVRDGADLRYTHKCHTLCQIIDILEDIDDQIRASWYE